MGMGYLFYQRWRDLEMSESSVTNSLMKTVITATGPESRSEFFSRMSGKCSQDIYSAPGIFPTFRKDLVNKKETPNMFINHIHLKKPIQFVYYF